MLCRQVVKRIRPVVVCTENRRSRCERADPVDGGKLHLDAGRAELQIIIDPDLADGYRLGLVGVGDGKAAVCVLRIAGGIAVHRLFFHGIMLRAVGQIDKGMLPSIARIQFSGIHHMAGVLFFQMHRHTVRLSILIAFVVPDLLNGDLVGLITGIANDNAAVGTNSAAVGRRIVFDDQLRTTRCGADGVRICIGFQADAARLLLDAADLHRVCRVVSAHIQNHAGMIGSIGKVCNGTIFVPLDLSAAQHPAGDRGAVLSIMAAGGGCKIIACTGCGIFVECHTVGQVELCITGGAEPRAAALVCGVVADDRIFHIKGRVSWRAELARRALAIHAAAIHGRIAADHTGQQLHAVAQRVDTAAACIRMVVGNAATVKDERRHISCVGNRVVYANAAAIAAPIGVDLTAAHQEHRVILQIDRTRCIIIGIVGAAHIVMDAAAGHLKIGFSRICALRHDTAAAHTGIVADLAAGQFKTALAIEQNTRRGQRSVLRRCFDLIVLDRAAAHCKGGTLAHADGTAVCTVDLIVFDGAVFQDKVCPCAPVVDHTGVVRYNAAGEQDARAIQRQFALVRDHTARVVLSVQLDTSLKLQRSILRDHKQIVRFMASVAKDDLPGVRRDDHRFACRNLDRSIQLDILFNYDRFPAHRSGVYGSL